MRGDFPSKPMSLYATIWDASDWATNGGKYRVNYKYAPYVAEFSDMMLHGCAVDPIEPSMQRCEGSTNDFYGEITPSRRLKMENLRRKHMTYSYCYDRARYNVAPPECVLNPREAERLKRFDPVTFGSGRRRDRKQHHRGVQTKRSEADSV